MNIEERLEKQSAEHAWLVFLYGPDIVSNILHHLEYKKELTLRIPKRYEVVAHDVVEYYNRWNKEFMI